MLENYTVLVVDDCQMTRVTVNQVLVSCGCGSILEAGDGEEAIEILGTTPVHIVISDWNMPRMDGISFLRKARDKLRLLDTRFIMLTGENEVARVREAVAYGFDSYLTKPIDATALLRTIQKVLHELAQDFAPYLMEINTLLIENSKPIRNVLRVLMKNIGVCSITTLDTASEAVALFETGEAPNVVICDWNLPNMDGLELLAWMRDRESLQNVPFLMISSEKKSERIQEALERGVDEYLIKPFHQTEIARKLVRAIAKYS